jgi:hypothetical protein
MLLSVNFVVSKHERIWRSPKVSGTSTISWLGLCLDNLLNVRRKALLARKVEVYFSKIVQTQTTAAYMVTWSSQCPTSIANYYENKLNTHNSCCKAFPRWQYCVLECWHWMDYHWLCKFEQLRKESLRLTSHKFRFNWFLLFTNDGCVLKDELKLLLEIHQPMPVLCST